MQRFFPCYWQIGWLRTLKHWSPLVKVLLLKSDASKTTSCTPRIWCAGCTEQKKTSLFLKLDIHKAFDIVNWAYLLESLEALGFGPRWREWISMLFRTSTSRALLNGQPNENFKYKRGVRQGDPLSPMLFILAIDPLQKLLDLATQNGVLTPDNTSNGQIRNLSLC